MKGAARRMFFVAGAKYGRRLRGYTLHLCPICRCVRKYAVYELQESQHVYFVPVTVAKSTGTLMVCAECGVRLAPKSSLRLSVHHSSSFSTLWEVLAPGTRDRLLVEAEAELRLLRGGREVEPDRRRVALARSLRAVETELASKIEGGRRHEPSFAAALFCCVFGILGALALAAGFIAHGDGLRIGPLLLGGTFLSLATFFAFRLLPGRLLQARLMPRLARGLAPLAPSRTELTEVIRELSGAGLHIARWTTPDALALAIDDYRTDVLPTASNGQSW